MDHTDHSQIRKKYEHMDHTGHSEKREALEEAIIGRIWASPEEIEAAEECENHILHIIK